MNTFIWKIYWSCGPYDNPDDGVATVEAETAREAIDKFQAEADKGWQPVAVDGVMRADLED